MSGHRGRAGEPSSAGAHRSAAPRRVPSVVITVSDTRTLADDTGGALLVELLEGAGHPVAGRVLVPDDVGAIQNALDEAVMRDDVAAVFLTGGTGIAPRDVTYEVVAGLLDKTLDGFGEAFRRLSWDEIGPRAVLSRAIAGTRGRTLVVALPGSTKAVELGIARVLLPIATHVIGLLRG